MARVQNTLIGRASGSVGNVVFLTWKLLNVTRSKPMSVANPNTIPQQWQRNRFAETVALYNLLKMPLSLGLVNRNRKMTLFNAFQHWNQQNMFTNNPDGSINFIPENMVLSKGLGVKTPFSLFDYPGPNVHIQPIWNEALQMGQSDEDLLCLVWFNITQNRYLISVGEYNRTQSGVEIDTGAIVGGGNPQVCWSFFYNPTTKFLSDTAFASVNY